MGRHVRYLGCIAAVGDFIARLLVSPCSRLSIVKSHAGNHRRARCFQALPLRSARFLYARDLRSGMGPWSDGALHDRKATVVVAQSPPRQDGAMATQTRPETRSMLGASLRDSLLSSSLMRNALVFCCFEVAYYFAYRYGMSFNQATASPFWFPDSVLLCALLCTRARWWLLLIAATIPIRLFSEVATGVPFSLLAGTTLND